MPLDVTNAEILYISPIEEKNGKKRLAIDVATPSTPKKRYLVFENKNVSFDLIRRFQRDYWKVGDTIEFDFNKSLYENGYDTIWRINLIQKS